MQKRRNVFRKFLKSRTLKFVTMSCRRQERAKKFAWVHNYIPFLVHNGIQS